MNFNFKLQAEIYIISVYSLTLLFKRDNNTKYTANENSKITDKLRYLLIISKHKYLFLDIFESCYNHRQISAKIKIKSHIHQKN